MPLKFKLKSFPFKKTSEKKAPTVSVITQLPNELLVCIYQHLESKDSLEEFSRTCRRFHKISKDIRSKAAWMVTRFGTRCAIYYALLSVPERCNRLFLERMMHMGARVPPHLIQSLVQVYGKQEHTTTTRRHRHRRGSHLDDLQDEFFSRQIQKIPFEGYVTLLCQQTTIHVQEDDVSLFLSSLESKTDDWKDMVYARGFFPAPLLQQETKKGCYRQVLKFAQTPAYYTIAAVFAFDPVARAALWEAVLLVLFDEAFRSSDPSPDRISLLQTTQQVLASPVELVGPMNDQAIFCQVFAQFFTKYPVGYCKSTTMDKLLTLLHTYVKPATFGVPHALEYIVLAQLGRADTTQCIDNYLNKKQ